MKINIGQQQNERVCYWDNNKQELVGNVKAKIMKILRERLIVPDDEAQVIEIDPLPGNHIKHIVDQYLQTCTCQAYHTTGMACSHIHAVNIWLEDVEKGGRQWDEGKERRKNEQVER